MRAKTAKWYETTIAYDKMLENGLLKTVTETYSVEAPSFADGETKTLTEMSTYISGEFEVTKMAIAPYKEVWFSDKQEDDFWFKAKLQFITLDEKTMKAKRQTTYYLVQAKDFDTAKVYVGEVMDKTMINYVISQISETKVLDVYEQ